MGVIKAQVTEKSNTATQVMDRATVLKTKTTNNVKGLGNSTKAKKLVTYKESSTSTAETAKKAIETPTTTQKIVKVSATVYKTNVTETTPTETTANITPEDIIKPTGKPKTLVAKIIPALNACVAGKYISETLLGEASPRAPTYVSTGTQTAPIATTSTFNAIYGRDPTSSDTFSASGAGHFATTAPIPTDLRYGRPFPAPSKTAPQTTSYVSSGFQTMAPADRTKALITAKAKAAITVEQHAAAALAANTRIWAERRGEFTVHSGMLGGGVPNVRWEDVVVAPVANKTKTVAADVPRRVVKRRAGGSVVIERPPKAVKVVPLAARMMVSGAQTPLPPAAAEKQGRKRLARDEAEDEAPQKRVKSVAAAGGGMRRRREDQALYVPRARRGGMA